MASMMKAEFCHTLPYCGTPLPIILALFEILRYERAASGQESTKPTDSMPLFASPLCCRFLLNDQGDVMLNILLSRLPRCCQRQ